MKIAQIITRSERGGAQSHVLELLRGLNSCCDLTLICGEHGFLCEEAEQLQIRTRVVNRLVQPLSPINDCLAVRSLCEILRADKPDIVHAHSSKAGIIGRIAARSVGIPAVFTAHGWAFTDGAPLLRKLVAVPLELFAGRLSNEIITVSDFDRRLAERYHVTATRRMLTIHNGITGCGGVAPTLIEPPTIISVARLAPPKDPFLIIDALKGIREEFQFWFAGDGPLRTAAEKRVSALGLASKVRFLGDRFDIPELLRRSQIFVLASNYEGLPISIIEAMSCGLPVVASNVGGVSELVEHDVSGKIFPRGDESRLREFLTELINNPAMRQNLGGGGLRRFNACLRADQMVLAVKEVYASMLRDGVSRH